MIKDKFNSFVDFYLGEKVHSYVNRNEDLSQYLRFDSGENFTIVNDVKKFVKTLGKYNLNEYPDPDISDLKKAIAKKFDVTENEVIIGSGSDEIIEIIPRVFLEPGDNGLIITPTFFRFEDSMSRMKSNIVRIATKENEGFEFTNKITDEIIEKVKKENVKLLWLCNPNNPTGTIIQPELIQKILENVKCVVAIDEVLYEFYDPEEKNSSIQLIKKYDNLIVIRSLSKTYALSGLRVGYGIANKDLLNVLEQYRLPYNITSVSQKIATNVLKDGVNLKKNSENMAALRTDLVKQLNGISGIKIGANSHTNTLLLKHETLDLFTLLKKNGILTADFRTAHGIENKGYIRITVRDKETNKLFIEKLKTLTQ